MEKAQRPRGRPGKFAKFEALEASLPPVMFKRPKYVDGIGLFRGTSAFSVWIKVRMPRGGTFKGKSIRPGDAIELKLGRRASWTWPDLVAERDRVQGLADRGEPIEAVNVETFSSYASEWLKRKKPVVKGYGILKGHVLTQLNPTFGGKALHTITVGDVNRWIGAQSQGVKPSTVQRQLSTLKAILNDAVVNGLIEHNPASRAERIRGIESRQRFVTDDEWATILTKADEIEAKLVSEVALKPQQKTGWMRDFLNWAHDSGMRRSEILNLRFANIRVIDGQAPKVEVLNTKSNRPRYVTCTAGMAAIIEARRRQGDRQPADFIFDVSLTTAKRALTKLWKATGLVDVRLHDLRRRHATILIGKGVDVRTVAGRLGHSGTSMLAKHYAVDRGDEEAAAIFA